MVSSVTPVADGIAGIRQIVATCNAIVADCHRWPCMRRVAIAIAGSGIDDDQAHHVAALAAFVRNGVKYLADPLHRELIHTPDVMLLEIDARGYVYEDCDGHCVLFATLAQAIGIPAEVVGVYSSDAAAQFDHVIVTVQLRGEAIDIDLCAKQGEAPVYPEKLHAP